MTAAELGSTRRVSLGRKDKSDLQVVSLERQESFSSTSTDYEEIDLSERTPPDSEANDSGSDIDDAESDKKIEIESPRDTQELELKEDSDEGHDIDDNDDDEKNDIVTDEENNSVWSDNEDFGNTVVLTDEGGIENNISTDEDDTENNLDLSDEDSEEDIQENSQNYLEALEALEDELNDSSNAINVLNDISITIANESLASHSPTNLGEHLEIVDDEYEDNTGLNQEIESDNESINELQMTSTQRIVVSQSDSENESDGKVEDKTEMTKENHCASESEMIVDQPVLGNHNLKEKKESVVSPAIISSEKVNTEVLVLKDRSKNNLKAENKKPTDLVAKPSPKVVKNTSSKLPSAEKTGLVTLPNLKKDKPQELLSKENTVGKSKEAKESRKVTETAHKGNEKVSSKAADRESKVEIPANKESKLSTEPKLKSDESEERMDFDQLSIEDEDSDFEEEEENQPAVKSKIGLNKIPTESKMRKRSFSSENDRTKQHSRSPERYRASSRSYRDRQRDQHLRDRSRERFSKRRSLSPSTDRRHRGSDSRYRRSRSRDRKQNRISSAKGRDRDRESRHFRSRSRSNSRNTTNRTEKVVKTNVDRPVKKESIRSSVQEHLELKKNLNARPLSTSPRKEIKTRDSGTEEKTARTKHAKSLSIETKVANGAKAVSKPKIQRDVDGVIIKQPKGLCPIFIVEQYHY